MTVLKVENKGKRITWEIVKLFFHRYLGHFYLTPLSKVQYNLTQIEKYLSVKPEKLKVLQTKDKTNNTTIKAKAFELTESVSSAEGNLLDMEHNIYLKVRANCFFA